MQKATASAVDAMNLNHGNMTLIDGCCGTGSLFFGLQTYPWKEIILNDKNALRTNFLNVIKKAPLKLIKKISKTDLSFVTDREIKNHQLNEFKAATNEYEEKRQNYKKVDCDIDIAYQMFF